MRMWCDALRLVADGEYSANGRTFDTSMCKAKRKKKTSRASRKGSESFGSMGAWLEKDEIN